MAKSKEQKKESLKEVEADLKDAKGVAIADFLGLKVNDFQELRSQCRESQVKCRVVKKRLLKLALDKNGIEGFSKDYEIGPGSTAVFTSAEDEINPARVVAKFAKDHEAVEIYGGILENKMLSSEEVVNLSKLLSKEELLAKLVGSINAPVSGFVRVLSANLRNLVGVLNAIKETK